MRRVLLIGGAAALMAMPAAALAGQPSGEPVTETDPTAADEAAGTTLPTTTEALHAEGAGAFRYEGSGSVAVDGRGSVRVIDTSDAGDLVVTATGFGAPSASKDGLARRYAGTGTITADGSSYRIVVDGRFTADVDDSATHGAVGQARVAGAGTTILEGGIPVPFWANQRILLSTGPMAVDLSGRGGPEWWRDRAGGHPGRTVRRTVTVKRVVVKAHGRRVVTERRVVTVKRFRWDPGALGATWRLNGPASGTVDITTLTGRVRVWDRSVAKDLAVVVPAGTTATTLADGSVVYSGLEGAAVKLTGTGFRMKVRASDVQGTFTQAAGNLARSYARGRGTFTTATATDVGPGRHGGVRVLLTPPAAVAQPAPATP